MRGRLAFLVPQRRNLWGIWHHVQLHSRPTVHFAVQFLRKSRRYSLYPSVRFPSPDCSRNTSVVERACRKLFCRTETHSFDWSNSTVSLKTPVCCWLIASEPTVILLTVDQTHTTTAPFGHPADTVKNSRPAVGNSRPFPPGTGAAFVPLLYKYFWDFYYAKRVPYPSGCINEKFGEVWEVSMPFFTKTFPLY